MNQDLFKESYESELKFRDQISTSVGSALSTTTLLGGAWVFLLQGFPFTRDTMTLAFSIPMFLFTLGLIVSVVAILMANTGYKYIVVPDAPALKGARDALFKFYVGRPKVAEARFDALLEQRYIQAAGTNSKHNQLRAGYVSWANKGIAFAAVFALLAAGLYFIASATKPEKPAKVEIVEPCDL